MSAREYVSVVRVVSALLYSFDPEGMGSTVFAPEDEYEVPAQRLVAAASDASDLQALVRQRFGTASDQLVNALVAALELYFGDRRQEGTAPSGA